MGRMRAGWVIVATRANCEFAVERGLRETGYRVFLPMARRFIRPHRGPQRACMMPLFPGYLFASDWNGWPQHQTLSGVIGLLRDAAGNDLRLGDADVDAIYRAQSSHDVPWRQQARADLAVGDRVHLDIGFGVDGWIESLSDSGKAIVRSMMFGRETRFEVPQNALDKALAVA